MATSAQPVQREPARAVSSPQSPERLAASLKRYQGEKAWAISTGRQMLRFRLLSKTPFDCPPPPQPPTLHFARRSGAPRHRNSQGSRTPYERRCHDPPLALKVHGRRQQRGDQSSGRQQQQPFSFPLHSTQGGNTFSSATLGKSRPQWTKKHAAFAVYHRKIRYGRP